MARISGVDIPKQKRVTFKRSVVFVIFVRLRESWNK
jgi:ribosomal protein S13